VYLSVSRYRAAGFGIDVSDIEDAELRAVLARASSLVDVYCGIPMQPSRHDFRGGAITGEQHEWRLSTDVTAGSRRVYLLHRPIQTVTGFVVKFTNSYQLTVDPANLFVNKLQGWAEVVSLAAVVSGLYPVGLNFGLYTPIAEVDYTYGYEFASIDERLYVVDGNTFQGVRGSWESGAEIKINGTVVESGDVDPDDPMATVDFEIFPTEGEVLFVEPRPATDVVTASYTYTLPDAIAEATGITATHLLGERALAAKGMAGLSSIKVAEVALARTNRGLLGLEQRDVIPADAASLLDPFRFRSVG